ncbi:DUF1361 domain-containing protein [Humisphaera borealis]|uniref:DUF1361 domain-containing protein n=1 Tax=Humisphaera borealis TaxID=2807512 RepID=A0A7M2WR29_9BACT|nr:DUF1361 domain-containing protein [Humisphaera borealis]QOV87987.1 DUF1361 domain-containing protein [Humisphaera borealis]
MNSRSGKTYPSMGDRIHSATGFPVLYWLAVIGCSGLSMSLLAARLAATRQVGHLSLVWDLFLAWLPVAPALGIYHLCRRPRINRLLLILLAGVWLLFFPNAPYLITEMIHLSPQYGPSPEILPAWLDKLLPAMAPQSSPEWFDFLLLSSIVVNGLLTAFTAMRLVERSIARRGGRLMSLALAGWIFLLASFGVALGRYARLNSWEVFTQPIETFEKIFQWMQVPRVGVFTLVFGALLAMFYIAAVHGGRREPDPQAGRGFER